MNLQTLIQGTLTFLNEIIIPAILAVAFVAFIWNAAQYFIIQGDSEEGQQKAKSLAVWSIAAFVAIAGFWGVVNLIVKDLGLRNEQITPDYMSGKGFSTPNDQRTTRTPQADEYPSVDAFGGDGGSIGPDAYPPEI